MPYPKVLAVLNTGRDMSPFRGFFDRHNAKSLCISSLPSIQPRSIIPLRCSHLKLFYSPEACSLAPHIVLKELEMPFDLVRVDQPTKTTSEGEDYFSISPCGYVAALKLDDGNILTEGSAILEFLADLKPDALLAPPVGSWERVRMRERLSFLSCELNSGMNPLFKAAIPDQIKELFRLRLLKRFDLLDKELSSSLYQLEGRFSVADAYLFTLLRWTKWFGFTLDPWPALQRFQERVGARPSAREALAAELSGVTGQSH